MVDKSNVLNLMKEQSNLDQACEIIKLLNDDYSAMRKGEEYIFTDDLYILRKAIAYLDGINDTLIQERETQRSIPFGIVNEILSEEEERFRRWEKNRGA